MTNLDKLVYNALYGSYQSTHYATAANTSSLKKTQDAYTLTRVLPGIRRNEVTVTVEEGVLKVAVSAPNCPEFARGYSNLQLQYWLESDADGANADAKLVDGVLTVSVPRVKPVRNVHTVTVN